MTIWRFKRADSFSTHGVAYRPKYSNGSQFESEYGVLVAWSLYNILLLDEGCSAEQGEYE